jgi:N-methylhydantoinase B
MSSATPVEESTALDPITYEVIRHRLWNINVEHGNAIIRASGSPICVYGHDFNPCILTEDAEYVYYGPFIQILSSAADLTVKWVMENRAEDPGIEDGDMFLSSDPWIGATHQMDVTLLCPVFIEGELFCWVANTIHQADMGGTTPGSFCPDARDVYVEPTPIPPVKIVEHGRLRPDIEHMYVRQSRMPELLSLDLRAAMGGNLTAKARILGLVERYGAATVKASMRRIIDDSERVFLDRLGRLPDGVWRERAFLEQSLPGERDVYQMCVNLEKRGDTLTFSNAGTDPQAGSLNCTVAGWRGGLVNAVSLAFCYDLLYAIGGPLRHLRFDATPGTICSAVHPGAVSNAAAFVIHMLLGMGGNVLGRMMVRDPEQRRKIFTSSAASSSLVSALSGINQHGKPWAGIHLELLAGGLSAFSHKDGVPTGGLVHDLQGRMPDAEELEQGAPLLYLYRRELRDSAGVGRWSRAVGPVAAHVTHGAERIDHSVSGCGFAAPTSPGLFGGHPGVTNRIAQVRNSDVREWFARGEIPSDLDQLAGEAVFPQPKSTGMWQTPDDVHEYRLSAGAGYGDPLLREPERVAEDLLLGYVSEPVALQYYGVAFVDDPGSGSRVVDEAATAERRAEMRRERIGGSDPVVAVPLSDELPRVSEYLVLRDGRIACRMCGHDVCGETEDYKTGLCRTDLPLTRANGLLADPARYVDAEFQYRLFACPSCATLVETEMARTTDPTLRDIELRPTVTRNPEGGVE